MLVLGSVWSKKVNHCNVQKTNITPNGWEHALWLFPPPGSCLPSSISQPIKKGKIFELKAKLNNEKKEKRKETVKKVIAI